MPASPPSGDMALSQVWTDPVTRAVVGVVTRQGDVQAATVQASGLPGAAAATRLAGGTASGPPTSGTFQLGDVVTDQSGNQWVCTAAGTPGTWTQGAAEQAARRTVGQNILVSVATRNNHYYGGLNGSSSAQTFRTKHKAVVDITSVSLEYGNSYGTTAGPQGDGPGALSVACSVEPAAGTIYRGFFGGAHLGTVNPGCVLRSDPIGVFIPRGTFFFVRTYVSGNWPWGLTMNTARGLGQDTTGDPAVTTDSGEGIASPTGTDVTASGNINSSYSVAYSPLAILGTTRTPTPSFIIIGDSIAMYADEIQDMGWATRALSNQWPCLKLAQAGETAQQWAVNGTAVPLVEMRKRLFRYGTHFIFADGRNDVSGGRALAQIQADLITAWTAAQAQAGISWQATITPKVTTTDQYATLANQTIDPNDSVRVALNTWIRDGAPILAGTAAAAGSSAAGTLRAGAAGHPLYGYLEVADVIEAARNSGKFSVTQVRTVTDAAMTASTKVITSATANFTAADLGKSVFMAGSGTAGATQTGTIDAVTNSTTVTMASTAITTVTGQNLQIGAATYDGTHPDGFWHRAIGAALAGQFSAAVTAYLAGGV